MQYHLEFLPIAAKQLRKLPPNIQQQLAEVIEELKINPYPVGCKKLTGIAGWRIRSGNYRVIYKTQDNLLLIVVLSLGHRKDIYRLF